MTDPILTARMDAHPTDSHTISRYLDTGGYVTLRSTLLGSKPEEVADCTAVNTTLYRLQFIDDLHRTDFRCAT